MNREYAKQTIDEIIFLPSNSLSMYFVLPVPRGTNVTFLYCERQVSRLVVQMLLLHLPGLPVVISRRLRITVTSSRRTRCSSMAIALFDMYDDFWDSTDMTVVFRPCVAIRR